MRSIEQYIALIRELGLGWLLYRAGYAMRRRFGFLRRATPAMSWSEMPAPELSLHSHPMPTILASWGNDCVAEAEAVLCGRFRLFSHREVEAGNPPDWHRNQIDQTDGPQKDAKSAEQQVSDLLPHLPTGRPNQSASGHSLAVPSTPHGSVRFQISPSLRHWSEISDFGGGDIKGIWELSRFPWAFTLTRAHARTGDEKYKETFWGLFADWCDRNPPNLGPNWMCGQEATFRLMAVTFAAEGLGVPFPKRELLARFVVTTGRRIDANLDYALSQKNNHGVSECVGLITAALLAPAHPQSAAWLARGLRELGAQLDELVYEDGGFSQHSLIYHRVLLHDLCWCRRRLELAGQGIPAWLDAAGGRALIFLITLTDPLTGQAPLYGANDGANILPLADAEFMDMRPVIQMTAAVFRGELPLPAGAWDEAAAWLRADWNSLRRVSWPPAPERWHAPVEGCFQVTQGSDRLFFRCPTRFRHRPAQADMLQVDIRQAGRPIALDGGSFSYNSTERFVVLGAASQHNVLTVDGREPLQKFSRFLYLPWPTGEAGEAENGAFRASHTGYDALCIRWTREVSRNTSGTGFTVRDKVLGAAGHTLRWHWRLADLPWQMSAPGDRVAISGYQVSWTGWPAGRPRLLRADETTALGWWSPYYGSVVPAAALLIEAEAGGDIELVTEFSPLPG